MDLYSRTGGNGHVRGPDRLVPRARVDSFLPHPHTNLEPGNGVWRAWLPLAAQMAIAGMVFMFSLLHDPE